MYIELLQVLTYFGGHPRPQTIPAINWNALSDFHFNNHHINEKKSHLYSLPKRKQQGNYTFIFMDQHILLESITHFIFAVTSLSMTLLLHKLIFTYSLEVGSGEGLKNAPHIIKKSTETKSLY
jgi:hypothetical protein